MMCPLSVRWRTRSAAWPATRRLEAARSSHAVVGGGRARARSRRYTGRVIASGGRLQLPTAARRRRFPARHLSASGWRALLPDPVRSRWGPHPAPRGRRLLAGPHGAPIPISPVSPAPLPPAAYCAAAADPPHCHIQSITCSRSATEQNPLTVTRHPPIHVKLTREHLFLLSTACMLHAKDFTVYYYFKLYSIDQGLPFCGHLTPTHIGAHVTGGRHTTNHISAYSA